MASRLVSGGSDVAARGTAASVVCAGPGTTVDGLGTVAAVGAEGEDFDAAGVCAIGLGAAEPCTAALRPVKPCAVATCAAGFCATGAGGTGA